MVANTATPNQPLARVSISPEKAVCAGLDTLRVFAHRVGILGGEDGAPTQVDC
jgi:hypothetical protein